MFCWGRCGHRQNVEGKEGGVGHPSNDIVDCVTIDPVIRSRYTIEPWELVGGLVTQSLEDSYVLLSETHVLFVPGLTTSNLVTFKAG